MLGGGAWSVLRKKLPSGGRRHLGVARTGWSLAWGLALRVCGSLWRMNRGRPISLEEGVSQSLHVSPLTVHLETLAFSPQ